MNVFMFTSGILSCRTLHDNICLVRGLNVTGSLSLMNKPNPSEASSWMLRSSLNMLNWRGSRIIKLTPKNGAKTEPNYVVAFQAYEGKYPLQFFKYLFQLEIFISVYKKPVFSLVLPLVISWLHLHSC